VKAKAEYEALNAQLLDDMPKLFALSMDILYNAIHLFLRLQYSFYAHAANQFSAGPLVFILSDFLYLFFPLLQKNAKFWTYRWPEVAFT